MRVLLDIIATRIYGILSFFPLMNMFTVIQYYVVVEDSVMEVEHIGVFKRVRAGRTSFRRM